MTSYSSPGIYPTLAMFNHSCDPSIVRFYVEDVVAVQAIKNIRKGEEICENYGPIFFHSNREDRQVSTDHDVCEAMIIYPTFLFFLNTRNA